MEASAATPIHVLVVDDHEIVRQGLVMLLERRPGFQVDAVAASVAEAVEAARLVGPDLVLMDVHLPDGSGIEACRRIRAESPEVRVVMLSSADDEETVRASVAAGASSYAPKLMRARDLVALLEAVMREPIMSDRVLLGGILERVRRLAGRGAKDAFAMLTAQERKILFLLADGRTNKEIAQQVGLSDKTVKNYVSSILSKLQVERRAQAAALVARHVRPEDDAWRTH